MEVSNNSKYCRDDMHRSEEYIFNKSLNSTALWIVPWRTFSHHTTSLNKIKLKTNMQHRIKESLKDNFLLSLLLFSILWIPLAIMVIHKLSNSIFFILIKYGRIGWNCRSFSVMINYSTNINKNNNYLLIQLNRIFLVFKHVLFRQLLIRI